ncbi:MAG TPA: hypothetical protein VF950_13095 [Planctomycetota bacterium]
MVPNASEMGLLNQLLFKARQRVRYPMPPAGAPSSQGVYFLYHRDVVEAPFYVGKAESSGFHARLRKHYEKLKALAGAAKLEDGDFSYAWLELRGDIPRAENLLRWYFQPVFDRSGFGTKPGRGGVQKPSWMKLLNTFLVLARTFDY